MWKKARFKGRDTHGHYTGILSDLTIDDRHGFHQCTHMDRELFYEMAETLQGRLQRISTWYIAPLEAGLEMAVVLRFLAMRDLTSCLAKWQSSITKKIDT